MTESSLGREFGHHKKGKQRCKQEVKKYHDIVGADLVFLRRLESCYRKLFEEKHSYDNFKNFL